MSTGVAAPSSPTVASPPEPATGEVVSSSSSLAPATVPAPPPPSDSFVGGDFLFEDILSLCALWPVGVEESGGDVRLVLLVSSWIDRDSLFILHVNLLRTSSMDLLLPAAAVPLPLLLLLLFWVTVLLLL